MNNKNNPFVVTIYMDMDMQAVKWQLAYMTVKWQFGFPCFSKTAVSAYGFWNVEA